MDEEQATQINQPLVEGNSGGDYLSSSEDGWGLVISDEIICEYDDGCF